MGTRQINNIPKQLITFLENSLEPMMITSSKFENPHPKILFCNKAFEILSGYTFNELYNTSPRILQGIESNLKVFENMKKALDEEGKFEGRILNYKKNGSTYEVMFRMFYLNDKNDDFIMCSFKNIDDTLKNRITDEIFKLSMESAVEHVAVVSLDEKYIYVNDSYSKRCGYTKEELLQSDPSILKSGKHDSDFYLTLRKNLYRKEPFEAVFINKHKDGSLYYDKQTITPVIIDDIIQSYLVVGKDISMELQNKIHLKNLALKDQLTSLYNRNGFEKSISKIVLNHASNNYEYTFIMADIDFFKHINDEYGHSIGDEILKEFSSLILQNIRATDYAFRWGGEEFLVVLNTDVKNAYKIIEKLRIQIEEYIFFADIKLTASFGITSLKIGNHSETINQCDEALYEAKENGRNKVIVYNE